MTGDKKELITDKLNQISSVSQLIDSITPMRVKQFKGPYRLHAGQEPSLYKKCRNVCSHAELLRHTELNLISPSGEIIDLTKDENRLIFDTIMPEIEYLNFNSDLKLPTDLIPEINIQIEATHPNFSHYMFDIINGFKDDELDNLMQCFFEEVTHSKYINALNIFFSQILTHPTFEMNSQNVGENFIRNALFADIAKIIIGCVKMEP